MSERPEEVTERETDKSVGTVMEPVMRGPPLQDPAIAFRRFRTRVLLQIALSVIPSAFLLWMGKPSLSAGYFWGITLVMMARMGLSGKREDLLAFAIGLIPYISLLRSFAFYNIIAFLYGGVIIYYNIHSHGGVREVLRRTPVAVGMLLFVTLYYLFSFAFTRSYGTNLRLFDFAFSAIGVLTLGRNRKVLSVALLGIVISACALGFSMLPYLKPEMGGRLGMISVDGHVLGNPVSLGTPLALALLALIADGGTWLNLGRRPLIRWGLFLPVLTLLALTTSRAAWLSVATGLVAAMLFGRGARLRTILLVVFGGILLQAVLMSPYGESFQRGIDRTFSEERSVRSRTSGRTDQWIVSYYIFTSSVGSMLVGNGPGLGPVLYARYSKDLDNINFAVGRQMEFHSLFMQVGVESGVLGLLPLLGGLSYVFIRAFLGLRRYGVIFPFTCVLGYLSIVATVSGDDPISGAFLGIGMLATMRLPAATSSLRRARRTSFSKIPGAALQEESSSRETQAGLDSTI